MRLPCMPWPFFVLLELALFLCLIGNQTQIGLCFITGGFALGMATAMWISKYREINRDEEKWQHKPQLSSENKDRDT